MILFGHELKSNFGKLIAWILVLSVLVGLMMAFYPLMLDGNMKSIFDNFQSSLSENLTFAFGFEEKIDYTNMGQYIAFIYQYIAVLIVIFAMQLGASSLSKEQGLGNIDYIYSNPISRGEIVTEKLLANILTYILFLIVMGAVTFGFSLFFKTEDIRKQQLLIDIVMVFVGLLGSGLVYMSIGYFYSALTKSSNQADGISVLVVLISIIIIIAGKIVGDNFKTVVDLFALEVFKPIKFMLSNFDVLGLGVNLLGFALFILMTYIVYGYKEFK